MESSGYTVIKSRRKTIGLSVGRGGEIIVRAPYGCSKRAIERFVRDSEGWIAKQRKKLLDMEAEAEDQGKLTEADIKARFADGVLTLNVPKKEPVPKIPEKKIIAIE